MTLLVSSSAERRLTAARQWLGERLDAGEEVLILGPARTATDDLLRRVAREHGLLFGVHRATIAQLAAQLATPELAAAGRVPVAGLGIEALAARAAAQCHANDELDYFAPVAEAPGFGRVLARTLFELRRHAVDGERLAASGAAGADLARLLDAYEHEMATRRLVDDIDLMSYAASAVEAGQSLDPLIGLPLLLLDLTLNGVAENRLLRALVERAPTVMATMLAGDDDAATHLGALLGTARDLDTAAEDEDNRADTRLERLRRDIFRADLEHDPRDFDDDSVGFLGAPGEGRECVEIVRRARDLARDGVSFDRMAILVRDPDRYLPLLEEALGRADLPAWFSRGTVRPDSSGRALLALLACAAEDLPARRFAEYLSLGQVPALDDDGAPPKVEVAWTPPAEGQLSFKTDEVVTDDDPDLPDDEITVDDDETPVLGGTLRVPRGWEQLLVDASVVGGGPERWRERLRGLDESLRRRAASFADDDDRDTSGRARHTTSQLNRLKHLRAFAVPVIELLAALPERAVWGEWLDRLSTLASRVLARPQRVLAVLAELRPMAEVGPVSLDEVRRILEDRLTLLRTEPATRREGRIFVGTIDEARGRVFDAVFLPALAEGVFPRRHTEDPLLLDEVRERLDDALPTLDRRVARERLLLRIAIGAARHRLVVTYPNLDPLEGRARVPSFYALDLLRAADGRLPDLGALESSAAEAAQAILGWPAPRVPRAAIDEAEHDLAVLEPLLRHSTTVDERAGAARFLLTANDHLARSLRVRWQRWRPRLSAADGLVDPPTEAREHLAGQRLAARAYSATALQHWSQCPYRFLLQAIHRLRPREAPGPLEELDPLTRGSLIHEVQARLLSTLRDKELLPLDPNRLEPVLAYLDDAIDTVATRFRDDLVPAIPRVWRSEIEAIRLDLRGWMRAIANDPEWLPQHFELAYGLQGDDEAYDEASQAEPMAILTGEDGAMLLRGAIDLVERSSDGSRLRVTDHKTGKVHPKAKSNLMVGHGEVLQPLLYALAAEVGLGVPVESGRLFYCTRRGGYEEREVSLNAASKKRVGRVLRTIDHAVEHGFLPAAPAQGACRWCDYRMVCGPHEERRITIKRRSGASAGRLRPLDDVRTMP